MPRPGRRQPAEPAAADDEGTREDFARYYRQHRAGLTRFVMRHGANPHEAADAAQAAFNEAFRSWHLIDHRAAWLRTVALRVFLRQSVRPEEELTDAERAIGCGPLEAVVLREQQARVYAALDRLPGRQRQVMAWYLDGISTDEMAAALEMTPAAVRQNLSRARAHLRQHLGRRAPEGAP
ncbi:RNA polymerase sigma factor [Streptomyces buecherae]|uniref:Sigma-70 family RNA polymerase sigma factor n=1 Tax=Streptomyces buecherae TaxID=2763006 RepID=A0A7H8NIK0_9ACTN|nr:sigma-70 family RNA polymerase sigma factor [Streptomyces buecherae]QKW54250.1 sigma-70 family RNA polymerase sigma factor [Streptomyces buecherae]